MSQPETSPTAPTVCEPTRRAVLGFGAGALTVIALTACGSDATATGADDPVTSFTIVAEDVRWNMDRIVVPAATEVTVTVENRDRGIPHNFHVRSPGDPKTELEDGIVSQTLRFTVDKPGTYGFVCDAHPNMTGTVEVV